MKKIMPLVVAFIFCFSMISPVNAQDSIEVIINGRNISFDVEPQIINGRTYVPMRKIFQEMGASVFYDDDGNTQTITAEKGSKEIIMQVGSTTISVSGVNLTVDAAPIIIDSRTLVPVRAVSESLNATVEWNDNLNKVIIFDWDNITKSVIGYHKCNLIPDFGEYVGLDCTYINESVNLEDYYYANDYEYQNNLGTNKAEILADYKKVLEKNGFTLYNASNIIDNSEAYKIESDGNCYIIVLPKDLDVVAPGNDDNSVNDICIAQKK